MKLSYVCLIATVAGASAFTAPRMHVEGTSSRRVALQRGFMGFGAGASALLGAQPANAISTCAKGANNCFNVEWAPPSGMSAADAGKDLKAAIEAYPQEGITLH